MKRSLSLRSLIAAAVTAVLLGCTVTTHAYDDGYYDTYSEANELSWKAWNESVDAAVEGDSYEAYQWNSLSIDADSVADESWDKWNSSYSDDSSSDSSAE